MKTRFNGIMGVSIPVFNYIRFLFKLKEFHICSSGGEFPKQSSG